MMPAAAAHDVREGPVVDVVAESDLWTAHPAAEDVVRKAIEAASTFESRAGELALMLTDDATIQQFNAQWRGMDKPTNVLSFPASGAASEQDVHLGDIAIAFETVAREAEAENKTFYDHLAHLAIHGYLHLIGFDHETDEEACRMESLETRILSSLAIDDPYSDRKLAD